METSMYYNEYIISSNNSINENTHNSEKLKRSSSYRLKKMLKPFINLIKHSGNRKTATTKLTTTKTVCKCKSNSYEDDSIYDYTEEIDENQFNESLEHQIIDEIRHCEENSAIYVFDNEDKCQLTPIFNDDIYVPVHFARTQAGTFFWTTMQRSVDCDLVEPENCSSNSQLPQLQHHGYDRWVQA